MMIMPVNDFEDTCIFGGFDNANNNSISTSNTNKRAEKGYKDVE